MLPSLFSPTKGIVKLVKELQPLNELKPINLTEFGITTSVNAEHEVNADSPIISTLVPKSMLAKAVQEAKAFSSISFTLSPKTTLLIEVQFSKALMETLLAVVDTSSAKLVITDSVSFIQE